MDASDLWHSAFAPLRDRTHETAARLTQIDYDREMTMLAWQGERVAGLARSTADPDFEAAECAVIIRNDLRERGLALGLLQLLLRAIAGQGVRNAVMFFPSSLSRLRELSEQLEFQIAPAPDAENLLRAIKPLRQFPSA